MYYLKLFYRKVGKRHVELASKWVPSGAAYVGAGFMTLVYFTDWKVVAGKIPIYNTKFKGDQ